MQSSIYCNRIGGVMVIVLASSAVDHEFEPLSSQNKNYTNGICCFSAPIFNLQNTLASRFA
jgi:hypothetical protein